MFAAGGFVDKADGNNSEISWKKIGRKKDADVARCLLKVDVDPPGVRNHIHISEHVTLIKGFVGYSHTMFDRVVFNTSYYSQWPKVAQGCLAPLGWARQISEARQELLGYTLSMSMFAYTCAT